MGAIGCHPSQVIGLFKTQPVYGPGDLPKLGRDPTSEGGSAQGGNQRHKNLAPRPLHHHHPRALGVGWSKKRRAREAESMQPSEQSLRFSTRD